MTLVARYRLYNHLSYEVNILCGKVLGYIVLTGYY